MILFEFKKESAVLNMKILVCSAGYVGSRVVEQFLQAGHEVEVLRKSNVAMEGVKTHSIDMREQRADLGSFDLVFLCLSAGDFSEAGYRKTYIDAYRNIPSIDLASLKKIIMVSSTSVYSQNEAELVSEEDARASSFSGRVLLEAEKILQTYAKELCVLRLSGIYGPGRTRILKSVKDKTASYETGVSAFTNRIHIDDIIGFSSFVLKEGLCGTYNVSDSHPARKNELLAHLAGLYNVQLETAEAKPSLRSTNKKVSNKKMLETGYKLKYPSFVEAYGDLIEM